MVQMVRPFGQKHGQASVMFNYGHQYRGRFQTLLGIDPFLHEGVQIVVTGAGAQIVMGTGIGRGAKFGNNAVSQLRLLSNFHRTGPGEPMGKNAPALQIPSWGPPSRSSSTANSTRS